MIHDSAHVYVTRIMESKILVELFPNHAFDDANLGCTGIILKMSKHVFIVK